MSELPQDLRVGLESIDTRHEEFWKLFLALRGAPDSEFVAIFESVIAHTVQHFAEEEADWMS